MERWLRVLQLLIRKELAVELRGKEYATLLFCTTIVIGALIGAGVSSAVLDAATTTKIYPMLVWVVFLITTTTSSARASEAELDGRGFEGLLLAGVTGAQLYLSKVVVTTAMFSVTWVLLLAVTSAALDQTLSPVYGTLLLLGAGAALTVSALVVLVSGVAGTSTLRGVLMPLLTLPLLFPLFFAGVEITTECMLYGALTEGSIWPGVMTVLCAAFLLVGVNSYEAVVKG
jgi:ABC-type transport system involved in cytochrome c biogenesis permease component